MAAAVFGGCLSICVAFLVAFYAALPFLMLPVLPLTCGPERTLVVLTGVTGIIGRDAALHLAEQGYHVLGTAPSTEAAQALQSERNMTLLTCPKGSSACASEIQSAVDAQRAKGRHLGALVICDGLLPRDLARVDLGSGAAATVLAEAHSKNVIAPLELMGVLMPHLEEGVRSCGSSRVVHVGSLAGVASLPRHLAFAGAAGALERVADAARRMLRGSGIGVSLVQPGFVERGKDSAWHQRAMAKGTTTPAIVDAVTALRPRARYPCAAAYGLPARAIAGLVPLVPDALMDVLADYLEATPAPAAAAADKKEL